MAAEPETPSELATSEMPVSDLGDGEATPEPVQIPAFPPYPPYATEPAPPSVADTIIAGHDLRLQHKSVARKPLRPAPKPAKPRGPKATDVKMSKRALRAHARCLRKHGAILTDRLERMSKPQRRNIIYLWREHAYTLPPETISRLRSMLDADEPFKPDQAYEYFVNLKKTRKKATTAARVNEIKKDILAMCGEKRFVWARNATVAFARGIQQRLSRPGRYALADGMLRLSNIILDEICGYMNMRTPSRRSTNPKAKFMMEMADKVAVWIDEILSESDDRMLMMDFDEDDDITGPDTGGGGDERFADDFQDMMGAGPAGLLKQSKTTFSKFDGKMKEAFKILTDSMEEKGDEQLVSHGKFNQTYLAGAEMLRQTKDLGATEYSAKLAEKIKNNLAATVKDNTPAQVERAMKDMVDICSKYLAQNAEYNKKKGPAFKVLVNAMRSKPNEKLYQKGNIKKTNAQAADELEKAKNLDTDHDDPNLSQEIHSAMMKLVKDVTPDEMKKEMAETVDICSKYLSQKAVDQSERGPAFDLLIKELNKHGSEPFSDYPALSTKNAAAYTLTSAPGLASSPPDPKTIPEFKKALHNAVDAVTPRNMKQEMNDVIDRSANYLSGFIRDRGPAMDALMKMMESKPNNVFAKRNDYTMDYKTAANEAKTAPTLVPVLPVKDIAEEGKQHLTEDMKDVTPSKLKIPMQTLIDDVSKYLSQAVAMRSGVAGDRYPMNFLAAVKDSMGDKPLFKYKDYGQTYAEAADTLKHAGPLESAALLSTMNLEKQNITSKQNLAAKVEVGKSTVELGHEIASEMKRGVPGQLAPTIAEGLQPTMDKAAKHLANVGSGKGKALEHLVDLMKEKGEAPLGQLQGYQQTYSDGAKRIDDAPTLANEKVDKGAYEAVKTKLTELAAEKPMEKHAELLPEMVEQTAKFLSGPVPETPAEKRALLGDLIAREGDKILADDGIYKMTYKEAGKEIKNAPVGITKANDEVKKKEIEKKIEAVIPDKKIAALLKEPIAEGAAHLADVVKGRGEAMKVIQEGLKKEKDKEFIEVGDFKKTHEQAADMLAQAPNFSKEHASPVILERVEHQIATTPKDVPPDKPMAAKHMDDASKIASKYIAGVAAEQSGLSAKELAALDEAGFNADSKAAAEARRKAAVEGGVGTKVTEASKQAGGTGAEKVDAPGKGAGVAPTTDKGVSPTTGAGATAATGAGAASPTGTGAAAATGAEAAAASSTGAAAATGAGPVAATGTGADAAIGAGAAAATGPGAAAATDPGAAAATGAGAAAATDTGATAASGAGAASPTGTGAAAATGTGAVAATDAEAAAFTGTGAAAATGTGAAAATGTGAAAATGTGAAAATVAEAAAVTGTGAAADTGAGAAAVTGTGAATATGADAAATTGTGAAAATGTGADAATGAEAVAATDAGAAAATDAGTGAATGAGAPAVTGAEAAAVTGAEAAAVTGAEAAAATGAGTGAATGAGAPAASSTGAAAATGAGPVAATGTGADAAIGAEGAAATGPGAAAATGAGAAAATGAGAAAATGAESAAATGPGADAATGPGAAAATGPGAAAATGPGAAAATGAESAAATGPGAAAATGAEGTATGTGADAATGAGTDAATGAGTAATTGTGAVAATGAGTAAATGPGAAAATGPEAAAATGPGAAAATGPGAAAASGPGAAAATVAEGAAATGPGAAAATGAEGAAATGPGAAAATGAEGTATGTGADAATGAGTAATTGTGAVAATGAGTAAATGAGTAAATGPGAAAATGPEAAAATGPGAAAATGPGAAAASGPGAAAATGPGAAAATVAEGAATTGTGAATATTGPGAAAASGPGAAAATGTGADAATGAGAAAATGAGTAAATGTGAVAATGPGAAAATGPGAATAATGPGAATATSPGAAATSGPGAAATSGPGAAAATGAGTAAATGTGAVAATGAGAVAATGAGTVAATGPGAAAATGLGAAAATGPGAAAATGPGAAAATGPGAAAATGPGAAAASGPEAAATTGPGAEGAGYGPAGAGVGTGGVGVGRDGAVHGPGGTVLVPGSTVIGPDGAVYGPGGVTLSPSGAVYGPDGTAIGPDGTALGPGGTALGPSGARSGPGKVSYGTGAVEYSPGAVDYGPVFGETPEQRRRRLAEAEAYRKYEEEERRRLGDKEYFKRQAEKKLLLEASGLDGRKYRGGALGADYDPEHEAALDILHRELRAFGPQVFYEQPQSRLTYVQASDWLAAPYPMRVDKSVRDSGDTARLHKKFERKLNSLVSKVTPADLYDCMQDVVIESARRLSEFFVSTNYKNLVSEALISEMQKRGNEIFTEVDGAAETCFFAAQRLKKTSTLAVREPCYRVTHQLTKKLEDIIRNRSIPRKLTATMKEHVREAANYLSALVTKPDDQIEAYVALLNEMEAAGDTNLIYLISGDIPKTHKEAAAYLRQLTSFEDRIQLPNNVMQEDIKNKLTNLMSNVPPSGYSPAVMDTVIAESTGLLVSYIMLQGEKTEALKVLLQEIEQAGEGMLLRHGPIRKSFNEGAELLRGKTADQLTVPSADPVVSRKIQIRLNNLMQDKTPERYQPLMDDVIEDATMYLAVQFLQPQEVIHVCKCMKNAFVQCELWTDEIFRRLERPCCTCSRHVSAQLLQELAPAQRIRISPGQSRIFAPGLEISITNCPAQQRPTRAGEKSEPPRPCPAPVPTPGCHQTATTSYLLYNTTYNKFGYNSLQPTPSASGSSYSPLSPSPSSPAQISKDSSPFRTLIEDIHTDNVNFVEEQQHQLQEQEQIHHHSSLEAEKPQPSEQSTQSFYTPDSHGLLPGTTSSLSNQPSPSAMFSSTQKSDTSSRITQAKSGYSSRTPISTDQMADWHAMMVSLMWNVQAWRDWIQEIVDSALAHQVNPNITREQTADNWTTFHRRVSTEALQWRQYSIFSRQLTSRLSLRYRDKEVVSPRRYTVKTKLYLACLEEMLDIIDMFNRWTQWLTLVVKETDSLQDNPASDIPLNEMRWNYLKKKAEDYSKDWVKYNMYLKVSWEQKYSAVIADYLPSWKEPGPVWVVSACGAVPSGAVAAGVYDGEVTWVARTTHRSNVLPAALYPSKHCCLVYAEGEVHRYTKYQVMCNSEVRWVAWRGGAIGDRAVKVADGTHVGRVHYRGDHLLGAVLEPHYRCHVVIFGRPFAFNCYELLVLAGDANN